MYTVLRIAPPLSISACRKPKYDRYITLRLELHVYLYLPRAPLTGLLQTSEGAATVNITLLQIASGSYYTNI